MTGNATAASCVASAVPLAEAAQQCSNVSRLTRSVGGITMPLSFDSWL